MKTFIFAAAAVALASGTALADMRVMVQDPDGSGWIPFDQYAATVPAVDTTSGVLTQGEVGAVAIQAAPPVDMDTAFAAPEGISWSGNNMIIRWPSVDVMIDPGE